MLGDGDGGVLMSVLMSSSSKHPRSTLRAGVGMGADTESSCCRHGEALVLVFIIVVYFGGWLSAGTRLSHHHRCGVLGLSLVAFWYNLCHRRLLYGGLSGLV